MYSGCIVRITKDGGFPAGNLPWWKKPKGCWASGLRNPFTSGWDLETGRYFIGEVGSNDHSKAWEVCQFP